MAKNIKINSIYPKRKNAAAVIGMSWNCLKRKCMAAVNRKTRQPKNKWHGPVQGDQRHGLNIKINSIYPKIERNGRRNWNVTARPK
jgi:hypothetical protein